jgi:hypothetical protein
LLKNGSWIFVANNSFCETISQFKKIHLTTKEIKGPNPKTPLMYDGISCKTLVVVLKLNCTSKIVTREIPSI